MALLGLCWWIAVSPPLYALSLTAPVTTGRFFMELARMAMVRWEPFVSRVDARLGTLDEARVQQWEVMHACCLDMAACEQMGAHDALRTRAQLYRAYNELAKGYVAIHQAALMDGRFRTALDTLRSAGQLPGDFRV